MRRRSRLQWGPSPGSARLQAELAKDERWWVGALVGAVMIVVVVLALVRCADAHLPPDGRVGPPTRDATQRHWHGEPGTITEPTRPPAS